MGSQTHTHHTCDRCGLERVIERYEQRTLPLGWMEVRGEMWNGEDSIGVQFFALICHDCRSALVDWKERIG